MAVFFVGQRVRVVLSRSIHHGKETRITGVGVPGNDYISGPFIGYQVDLPAQGWPRAVFEAHELEPILDANEPCESDFRESLDKLLSEVSRETV